MCNSVGDGSLSGNDDDCRFYRSTVRHTVESGYRGESETVTITRVEESDGKLGWFFGL